MEVSIIRRTLGLLSSMVYSGDSHSDASEKQMNTALKALDKLEAHNKKLVLGIESITKTWDEYDGFLLDPDDIYKILCELLKQGE